MPADTVRNQCKPAKRHHDLASVIADSECGKNSTPPVLPRFIQDPILSRTYAIGRYLGKGGFAWCYEVKDIQDQSAYALKVVPKTNNFGHHQREKVLREIRIHYPLRHEHIVRLYSAFEDDDQIYMVLELCQMESLMQVLKRKQCLSEHESRYYLRQILLGARYLHEEAQVLHRDLKLGNMLLSDTGNIKIADFGLAAYIHENNAQSGIQVCGTPNYLAPEVLRKEGHSVASESWAIGCILFAMLTGKPPFETNSLDVTYSLILGCRYSFPANCQHLSRAAKNLIRSLLHPKPSYRPSISQVLDHEFFALSVPICPNLETRGSLGKTERNTDFVQDPLCSKGNNIPNHNNKLAEVGMEQKIMVNAADIVSRNGVTANVQFIDNSNSLSGNGSTEVTSNSQKTNFHARGPSASSIPSTNFRSTNDSPDSGYSSAIAGTDTSGRNTFGPVEIGDLKRWIRGYSGALSDIMNCSVLNHGEPKELVEPGIIYVTKWIDYSNRYGFGCEYSDGGVSISEIIGTKLCLNPDRRSCHQWTMGPSSKSQCLLSTCYDLQSETDQLALGQSYQVLQHFVKYMDSNLLCTGKSKRWGIKKQIPPKVHFIVSWKRFPDCIVILLSDGTFQVNFSHTHMKFVLSHIPNASQSRETLVITYIDMSRIARSYLLNSQIYHILDHQLLQRFHCLLSNFTSSLSLLALPE